MSQKNKRDVSKGPAAAEDYYGEKSREEARRTIVVKKVAVKKNKA
jgi:hypothetical protein